MSDPKACGYAVVSGGSSGIGLACAKELARRGHRLVLIARDATRLEQARSLVEQAGSPEALVFAADVTNADACAAIFDDLTKRQARIEWLVTSAGDVEPGLFDELGIAAHRRQMELNYFGTLNLVEPAARHMAAQGYGRIIVVSSAAAIVGVAGYSAYGASKFAIRGLAEALRVELEPRGVICSVAYTTLDDKAYYLRLMRRIVETADHIVTVSEASRRDIIRMLDCPEDKVTNTYQSVAIPRALQYKSEAEVASEIEGALGLPYKGYLLFYGAIEPKKNVGRLIEAYLTSGVDLPLVLIGSMAWKSDQELRLLEAARKSTASGATSTSSADRIRHFDYAPFSLLVSAIRGARATIFPSLYEGFGLPVLESMILGTPVVTSREGATAEIAGDAALLVDPYDVRDTAQALRAMVEKDDLARDLSCSGLKQARLFDATHYARRLESVQALLAARL